MAVAGVDLMLLPTRVADTMASTSTTLGYNDSLHAAASADITGMGIDVPLTAQTAKVLAPEKASDQMRRKRLLQHSASILHAPQHMCLPSDMWRDVGRLEATPARLQGALWAKSCFVHLRCGPWQRVSFRHAHSPQRLWSPLTSPLHASAWTP